METIAERKPPQGEALARTTPTDLLAMAVSQNADIDKLKQLMDLQERWERNEARKAFVEAMNAFKKNPPTIDKNKTVSFGQTSYKHATLDHVCEQVTKGLSQHGISHRWTVQQEAGAIKVTCVLTHEQGHSEETTLIGQPDTSGSKNSIQAIGSTVTYLQRYTLLAATGLAAQGDDDAQGAVSNGDLTERIEFLMNCSTEVELRELFTQYYKEFKGNVAAQKALVKAKDARKKELD